MITQSAYTSFGNWNSLIRLHGLTPCICGDEEMTKADYITSASIKAACCHLINFTTFTKFHLDHAKEKTSTS